MRLSRNAEQRTELNLTQKVDPRVVLSSQILQMNHQQLEQAIEAELNENPALERLEQEEAPVSEETILRIVAPHELSPDSADYEFRRSLPADDSDPTWIELAATGNKLHDHLRAQLLPTLPSELRALGEYIVECVNEKGYLDSPSEEIALDSDVSLDDVEQVLKALQRCEPAGVGARTLQECLVLQLRANDDPLAKLAKAIVKHDFDEFVARRVGRICRKYAVLPALVESTFDLILSLSPFPGESGSFAAPAANERSFGITPEIAISRSEAGWSVDLTGPEPAAFGVDRAYRRRFDELERMERPPKDEKRHITVYVQRANDFIQCIRQRRVTMRRIGEYLVERQPSFLATGNYQFLQPLTRSQMAAELGLHESTVSRATMDKFVQIPTGEVVPFEVFFKPALRVQRIIEEILENENPDNPLSDQAIAELLEQKGIFIARRTVNKYRDRKRLLSSRKRRSA